jgi:hypothetical protein
MQKDPYKSGTFFALVLFCAAALCLFGMKNPVPGTEHVGQIAGVFFWILGFVVLIFAKTGAFRKEVVQYAEVRRRESFKGGLFQLVVLAIGIAIGFICKSNGYVDQTETHVSVATPADQAKSAAAKR